MFAKQMKQGGGGEGEGVCTEGIAGAKAGRFWNSIRFLENARSLRSLLKSKWGQGVGL